MRDMIDELRGAFYQTMGADKSLQANATPEHVALYMWLSAQRYESQQEVIALTYEPTSELAYLEPAAMTTMLDDLERWGMLEVLTKADADQRIAEVQFAPAYLQQYGIVALPGPRKLFRHPTSPLQDERIARLYKQHGYKGLGLLYTILEKLTGQGNSIDRTALKRQLKVSKRLERVWSSLEELGLITALDGQTDSPLTREQWRAVVVEPTC